MSTPTPGAAQKRVKVCIAAATYRRPVMLRGLLESLAALEHPADAETIVIIVDNDTERSAEATVRAFERDAPWPIVYAVEARRGIPTSRNRAIAVALEHGAELIAFVDDDETVDPLWLVSLLRTQRERTLQLVGGPVRVGATGAPGSRWQSMILDGITARYARKERAAARKAATGGDGGIVIVTNNWLIDATWLRARALRFDERLLLTGGTDTLFYNQAKGAGIRSGWSPAAIVYEVIPASRLSFRYQVARARDQATGAFHRKHAAVSPVRAVRTLLVAAAKMLGGCVCFLGLPLAGGRAVVQSARMIGGGWGLVRALGGRQSTLYRRTDGH